MAREIPNIEQKLTKIAIPLPNVHENTSFIAWQTLDDVCAQVEIADLLFRKAGFGSFSTCAKVVATQIDCYETMEEEANHTRSLYVKAYEDIMCNKTPSIPEGLKSSFLEQLECVERSESRLLREYLLLQKRYVALQKDVLAYSDVLLVDLVLPRPQEATIVLEHISELYGGCVD